MIGRPAALALLFVTAAAAEEPLQLNPFNDPFVQATTSVRACPTPRGPAYTEAELRQEAHYRVERGTSCWLAGRCSEPNAYRYDTGIAKGVVAALRADASLAAGSAIWVIAERRFVTLQGCVANAAQAARAEALARAVADVEVVIPVLAVPGEQPRYAVRPRADR